MVLRVAAHVVIMTITSEAMRHVREAIVTAGFPVSVRVMYGCIDTVRTTAEIVSS